MEGGSSQVHQSVVGRLLLLPTGVTVEQVIDLVSYFWNGKNNRRSTTLSNVRLTSHTNAIMAANNGSKIINTLHQKFCRKKRANLWGLH